MQPPRAWLSALLRKDARVQASGAQAQRLYASYGAWLRNLHAAGDKNFRVTLRLDAPPPGRLERERRAALDAALPAPGA